MDERFLLKFYTRLLTSNMLIFQSMKYSNFLSHFCCLFISGHLFPCVRRKGTNTARPPLQQVYLLLINHWYQTQAGTDGLHSAKSLKVSFFLCKRGRKYLPHLFYRVLWGLNGLINFCSFFSKDIYQKSILCPASSKLWGSQSTL